MEISLGAIITSIITSLSTEAIKKISSNVKLNKNEKDLKIAIDDHQTKITNFSSYISFREMRNKKSIDELYIPLELSFEKSLSIDNKYTPQIISPLCATKLIDDVISDSTDNLILIGAPGAGKTTTIKYICNKLISDPYFLSSFSFPLLIRFRENEFNNEDQYPVFRYIFKILGLEAEIINKKIKNEDKTPILNDFIKETILKVIRENNLILILDGFDEISKSSTKDNVLNDLFELSYFTNNSKFILTTRTGDDKFHIDNTQRFEISPLNDTQIKLLSANWLKENSIDFLEQLKKSTVYEYARRPLLISHLCAIYERDGRIPEKSKSIYKKMVNLLIEDWNQENRITRPTKFEMFSIDRKKDFLENLAYDFTFRFFKYQFSTQDLRKCYDNIHEKYDLPLEDINSVVNELQIENGLFTKTGLELYEFSHKSFQEYLCAEHIVKLPNLPLEMSFLNNPDIAALTVTLSSEPSDYFTMLIDNFLLKEKYNLGFTSAMFTRLKLERPDFTESYYLGFSLLELYTSLILTEVGNRINKSSSYDKSAIFSELLMEIDASFQNLFWSEKLVKSIQLFKYEMIYPNKIFNIEMIKISTDRNDNNKATPVFFNISKWFYQNAVTIGS